MQNAVIESFNGKMSGCPLGRKCLNQEWFTNLDEARTSIEKWREDYNGFRPHSSLGNLAPAVWAQQQQLAENLYAQLR